MQEPHCPTLYRINARVWLAELSPGPRLLLGAGKGFYVLSVMPKPDAGG
jgi:hypothetical protein